MVNSRMGIVISVLVILGLLLTACAPGAAPTPVPTKPAPTVAPAAQAPTATPAPAAEKPRSGGILTSSFSGDPSSFDSHQERTVLNLAPVAPAYSMLVQNDPMDVTKLIPDLADRWEVSPDGKVYTFYIHKGVKWHDGKPVTSADVKASFDRIIFPPKGVLSQRKDTFQAVDKLEAVDDSTVRFTLKFPHAGFLQMVANPYNLMFPKHLLDTDQTIMKKTIVGTGPYKFKDFSRGVSFDLVKNPDYFVPGRPYLDGITFYIIKDTAANTSALRTGRIMLNNGTFHPIRTQEREILVKENPTIVVQSRTNPVHQSFFPNHKRKPWSDVRVRKAADLVIDRQALIRIVAQGEGEVGGFMPPSTWAIPQAELLKLPGYRQPKDADIAEAKKLMAEAGYPDGFKANLVTRGDIKFYGDQSVVVKDQLRSIGIDISIQLLETGAFYARQASGDFDIDGAGFGLALADPDIAFAELFLTNSGANWGKYSNPKIDEMYVKQMQSMDPAERKKIVLDMQRILMDDYVRTVYYWSVYNAIHWPQVKGFVFGASIYLNNKLQDVWLSQ